MTAAWVAGACILAASSFVMGLAGFGIGLVSLAFLPWVMAPSTAVVLTTIYATVFAIVIIVPLRRDLSIAPVRDMIAGTLVAMPLGVWVLATLPASLLNRLIGVVLILVVLLQFLGRLPDTSPGRSWAFVAGALGGALGGAVGTPGPPVVVYATTQTWSPRTVKANLQGFFIVNQLAALAGYWWAGLLTKDVLRLSVDFAIPALAGVLAGVMLGNRIDRGRFRQIVYTLLFVSGIVLVIRG
ncbi:MAG: hypothetical protein DMD91_20850 [Candidatus Rokuibacteriota bacterium]|nr:MAG: hypothetical protein DMD91_20850 [Candidatus Rokubacteria bacterium]